MTSKNTLRWLTAGFMAKVAFALIRGEETMAQARAGIAQWIIIYNH